MKHKLLRLSLWLLTGALALLLLFFGVLYFHRDKIKAMVIAETNKLLEVPVAVGSIEVSLRKFPHASLRFSEVYSRGLGTGPADSLFFTESLYFEFDLWQVFADDLSIKRISAENGSLLVVMPEEGLPNYHIWKKDTTTTNSGFFTLEQVSLKNFKARFVHQSSATEIYGHIHEYAMSGNFGSSSLKLHHQAGLKLDSLLVDKENYFQNTHLTTNFLLEGIGDIFMIKSATATVNDMPITYRLLGQNTRVEIEAEAKNFDLEKFSQLARAQDWGWPDKTRLKGNGNLTYYSRHPYTDEDFFIKSELQFKNAQVNGPTGAEISQVKGLATYRYEKGTDELIIKEISGNGKSGSFAGALSLRNFDKPAVKLDFRSDLLLAEWMLLIPMDTLTNPTGRVMLDLHLENTFNSLINIQPRELARAKTRGKMNFTEVGFGFKNSQERIDLINAELQFNGSNLNIQNFYVQINESDIYLKGHFENVLSYAFFDDEKLAIRAKVVSRNIDLKDFVSAEGSTTESSYDLSFAHNVDMDLDLEVGKLVFHSFAAHDVLGQVRIKKGAIQGRNLAFNADEGRYTGQFSLDTRTIPHQFSAQLNTQNISLHHVFLSFNNFDQEAILAENIYGKATINLAMKASVSPNLEVNPASIDMNAQVRITDGAIRNYEPMTALSSYAEIDELQNVEFNNLENSIAIKNSVITIPKMLIQNNVMNLSIEGTHDFENMIDYEITLKLSEVLFSKRKKNRKKSEFDEHLVVVENDDDPTIHVKMIGPALDPKISLKRLNVAGENKPTGIFSKKPAPEKKNTGIRFRLFEDDQDSTSR